MNSYFISAVFLLNIFVLAWHNKLAPWLYLLAWVIYFVLHLDLQKNKINTKLFWKTLFGKQKYWHALAFSLPPLAFSLYSLDFRLLFGALLVNTILWIGVIYGKNVLR